MPKDEPSTPRLLHVLNGDAVRLKLERSGVAGTLAVWADALHEGPVPGGLSDDELRTVRTRYATARGWIEETLGGEMHLRWERGLEAYREHDEVVLWFEHDLFDQLLLLHHLDWFGRRPLGNTTLSLICIGEFPGVERFMGLGQLSPEALASLLGTRQRVTLRQLELGRAGWQAFTSSDPAALPRFLAGDTSALPFLAGALERLLEEYPAVGSGLPRTERMILEVLHAGAADRERVYGEVQKREERVFMGDGLFWSRIDDLAEGAAPLIRSVPPTLSGGSGALHMTELGRRVLAGEADWVAAGGFDRWIGGVHLQGPTQPWRWDPTLRRLVRASA